MRRRVLFATSSVGLGHVTRDFRLAQLMGWADVEWLTAGRALEYLSMRGADVHPASMELASLGDAISSMIPRCKVRLTPRGLWRLYGAAKANAEAIARLVDIGSYDLIVADEFWELLMGPGGWGVPSAFITDFVELATDGWRPPWSWLTPRADSAIWPRVVERFDLRIHVGFWGEGREGFWSPGQLSSHELAPPSAEPGREVVINVGGTDVGCAVAAGLSALLSREGIGHRVIGACGEMVPNPLPVLASARALVTLAGYSSLVEAAWLRKPAVILAVRGHFEHMENASAFSGRRGYRVLQCSEGLWGDGDFLSVLSSVLEEDPDPPALVDAAPAVADALRRMAGADRD